jgi:hypothetical protein
VAIVFSGLASKLVTTVSPSLASKLVVGFLVESQNQGGGGFPSLSLKTDSCGLMSWASKSPWWFLSLGLKITVAGYGLSVAPQNLCVDEDGMRHAMRSSGLLRVEASWARVS